MCISCTGDAVLGFFIGAGLIKTQTNKVKVLNLAKGQLTKNKGLPKVIYRRFVKGFATTAVPLTELTRVSAPNMVKWSDEAEKAFIDLKAAICSDLVLVSPDFVKPFVFQTDPEKKKQKTMRLQKRSVWP